MVVISQQVVYIPWFQLGEPQLELTCNTLSSLSPCSSQSLSTPLETSPESQVINSNKSLIPMSEENTESPPAKRNDREVEDKEDDEEEKGDEPVVEELQPQPVPAVIDNDSDSDEDTRPIAQRRVRR